MLTGHSLISLGKFISGGSMEKAFPWSLRLLAELRIPANMHRCRDITSAYQSFLCFLNFSCSTVASPLLHSGFIDLLSVLCHLASLSERVLMQTYIHPCISKDAWFIFTWVNRVEDIWYLKAQVTDALLILHKDTTWHGKEVNRRHQSPYARGSPKCLCIWGFVHSSQFSFAP